MRPQGLTTAKTVAKVSVVSLTAGEGAPPPAGMIGLRAGTAFAAADSLKVTLYGQGAHGSRPDASVDPIVMAAATVLRLQTIVSREIPAGETAVVTVGSIHAGTAANIIPDRAELGLSVRTFSTEVRDRVLAAIERIARGEAVTAGAPRVPDVELAVSFPAVINDEAACARTLPALQSVSPMIVDPGPVTGSEDVCMFASAAGAPYVYWLLGSADPAGFDGATTIDEIAARSRDVPSNHSPMFAPVIEPTLSTGIGGTDGRRDDMAPALSRAAGPRPGGAFLSSACWSANPLSQNQHRFWTSPQRLDVRLSPWRAVLGTQEHPSSVRARRQGTPPEAGLPCGKDTAAAEVR
jgi:metal-dependent amidase/aminoacylase/carboxypeptidase family protein